MATAVFKSQSVLLDRDLFGEEGVRYFLGAWVKHGADCSIEEHRAFRPTRAMMTQYVLDQDAGDSEVGERAD